MQSPSLLRARGAAGLRSLVETEVSSERAVDGGCSDVDEFWLLGCLKMPKFLRTQPLDGRIPQRRGGGTATDNDFFEGCTLHEIV